MLRLPCHTNSDKVGQKVSSIGDRMSYTRKVCEPYGDMMMANIVSEINRDIAPARLVDCISHYEFQFEKEEHLTMFLLKYGLSTSNP